MATIKETLNSIETKDSGSWTGNATLKELMQEVWVDFDVDKLLSDYAMKVPGDLLSTDGFGDNWGKIDKILPSTITVTSFGFKKDKATDTLGISGSFKVKEVEQSFFVIRTKVMPTDSVNKKSEYVFGFGFDLTTWGFSKDIPLTNVGLVISTSTFDNFTQWLPDGFIGLNPSNALLNINSMQANLEKGAYVLGTIDVDTLFNYVGKKEPKAIKTLFDASSAKDLGIDSKTDLLLELAYTKPKPDETNCLLNLKLPKAAKLSDTISLDSVIFSFGYKAGKLDFSIAGESSFTIPEKKGFIKKTDLSVWLSADLELSKTPTFTLSGEVTGENAEAWWNFIERLPGIWFKGLAVSIEIGVDTPKYGFGAMADIASSEPDSMHPASDEQAFYIEFSEDGDGLNPVYFNYFKNGDWDASDLATLVGVDTGAFGQLTSFLKSETTPVHIDTMWLYWDEEKVTLPGAKKSQTGISVQANINFALQGEAFFQLLLPISTTHPESMSLDATIILSDDFKLAGCMPITAGPSSDAGGCITAGDRAENKTKANSKNNETENNTIEGKAFVKVTPPTKFDDLLKMPKVTATTKEGNCAYMAMHIGKDGVNASGTAEVSLASAVNKTDKSLDAKGSFCVNMKPGDAPVAAFHFDIELELFDIFVDVGEALVASYQGPFHAEVVKLVNGLLELVKTAAHNALSPHIHFYTDLMLSTHSIHFDFIVDEIGLNDKLTTDGLNLGLDFDLNLDETGVWVEHFAENVASEIWGWLKDFIWGDILKMVAKALEHVAEAVAAYLAGMANQIGEKAVEAAEDVVKIIGDLLTDPSALAEDFDHLGEDLKAMLGFGSSESHIQFTPDFKGTYLAPGGQVVLTLQEDFEKDVDTTFFVKNTQLGTTTTVLARITSFDEKRRRIEQQRFAYVLNWVRSHQMVKPLGYENALAMQLYGQRIQLVPGTNEALQIDAPSALRVIEEKRGPVHGPSPRAKQSTEPDISNNGNTLPKFPYTAPEAGLSSTPLTVTVPKIDSKSAVNGTIEVPNEDERLNNWWIVPSLYQAPDEDGSKYISIVYQPPIDKVEDVKTIDELRDECATAIQQGLYFNNQKVARLLVEIAKRSPLELVPAFFDDETLKQLGGDNYALKFKKDYGYLPTQGDAQLVNSSIVKKKVNDKDTYTYQKPEWIRLSQGFLNNHNLNGFSARQDGFYLADTGTGIAARRLASDSDWYDYKGTDLKGDDELKKTASFVVELASPKGYHFKSLKSGLCVKYENNQFSMQTNSKQATIFQLNTLNEVSNTQTFGNGIDAAVAAGGSYFLFRGSEFIEFTNFNEYQEGIMSKDGVSTIKGNWGYEDNGLTLEKDAPAFLNGIDSAFVYNDQLYFTKGAYYAEFTDTTGKILKKVGKTSSVAWMWTDGNIITAARSLGIDAPWLICGDNIYEYDTDGKAGKLIGSVAEQWSDGIFKDISIDDKNGNAGCSTAFPRPDAMLQLPDGWSIIFNGDGWYYDQPDKLEREPILGKWILSTTEETYKAFGNGLDAAYYCSENDKFYLFKDNSWLSFLPNNNGTVSQGVDLIAGRWGGLKKPEVDSNTQMTKADATEIGKAFEFGIDAAVVNPADNKLYLFKGAYYASYTIITGSGTPLIGKIADKWALTGLKLTPKQGLSAVTAVDDTLYFFSGTDYVSYTGSVCSPVKKIQADWGNNSLLAKGVSAVMYYDKNVYLFSGSRYLMLPYGDIPNPKNNVKPVTINKIYSIAGHWGIKLAPTDFYSDLDAIFRVSELPESRFSSDGILAVKNNSVRVMSGTFGIVNDLGNTFDFRMSPGDICLLSDLPWSGISKEHDMSSMMQGIDASATKANGHRAYFFKGKDVAYINRTDKNDHQNKLEIGSIQSIDDYWNYQGNNSWKKFPMTGVDAAATVNCSSRAFYTKDYPYVMFLFKGENLVRYDSNDGTTIKGGKEEKISDVLKVPEWFQSDLDAAMPAGSNFIALFKGAKCVIAPIDGGRCSEVMTIEQFFNNDEPLPLQAFETGIDCGFTTAWGITYLFKGNSAIAILPNKNGEDAIVGPFLLPFENAVDEKSSFKFGVDAAYVQHMKPSTGYGGQNAFFFKGSQCLKMKIIEDRTGKFGRASHDWFEGLGPVPITDIWNIEGAGRDYNEFAHGIDAVVCGPAVDAGRRQRKGLPDTEDLVQDAVCVICGDKYAIFEGNKTDDEPASFEDGGSLYTLTNGQILSGIDSMDTAMLIGYQNKVFFFKANQWVAANIVDIGAPQQPWWSLRNFMGLEPLSIAEFEDGIDAAYNSGSHGNHSVYIFRGNSYIKKYTDKSIQEPRLIKGRWDMNDVWGIADDKVYYAYHTWARYGVDAAFLDPSNNSKLCLISGQSMLQYNDRTGYDSDKVTDLSQWKMVGKSIDALVGMKHSDGSYPTYVYHGQKVSEFDKDGKKAGTLTLAKGDKWGTKVAITKRVSAVIKVDDSGHPITIVGDDIVAPSHFGGSQTKYGKQYGTLYDYVTVKTEVENFEKGIDALLIRDKLTYLVKGNAYMQFADGATAHKEYSYLDDLFDLQEVRHFRDDIDAAMVHPTDKCVYLFHGAEYARFYGAMMVETGGITDVWNFGVNRAAFAKGIDAVCVYQPANATDASKDQIMFIKGSTVAIIKPDQAKTGADATNDTFVKISTIKEVFNIELEQVEKKPQPLDAAVWHAATSQFLLYSGTVVKQAGKPNSGATVVKKTLLDCYPGLVVPKKEGSK